MVAFRESEVFWWVLLMILSQTFKIIGYGVAGRRFINRSVVSSLGISAIPVTIVAFRELHLL